MWEPPPAKKKEKNLTKKVSKNDNLMLKLTLDPPHCKKIKEDKRKANKISMRSLVKYGLKMSPLQLHYQKDLQQ